MSVKNSNVPTHGYIGARQTYGCSAATDTVSFSKIKEKKYGINFI